MIANAQLERRPIIFCNDGFCEMSGYSRAEIMQRSSAMDFLHGPHTVPQSIREMREALYNTEESQVRILFYKKDGESHQRVVILADLASLVLNGVPKALSVDILPACVANSSQVHPNLNKLSA